MTRRSAKLSYASVFLYTFTRLIEHNRTEPISSPKSTNERETQRARAKGFRVDGRILGERLREDVGARRRHRRNGVDVDDDHLTVIDVDEGVDGGKTFNL